MHQAILTTKKFTYEIYKLISKSELNELLFKPVLFFIFTYFTFLLSKR